ncbi:MAG: hypothetical protein JWO62_840 [Acidimicrobiaceae bacterium]|nr:hypothetical protein [Acidimicrobiaceae bacterium]
MRNVRVTVTAISISRAAVVRMWCKSVPKTSEGPFLTTCDASTWTFLERTTGFEPATLTLAR